MNEMKIQLGLKDLKMIGIMLKINDCKAKKQQLEIHMTHE